MIQIDFTTENYSFNRVRVNKVKARDSMIKLIDGQKYYHFSSNIVIYNYYRSYKFETNICHDII